MAERLGWSDLVIEVDAATPYAAWLEPWRWLVQGRVTPRFLNRFGCWFLQRQDGSIELLDVFFGELGRVADDPASFQAMVNEPTWQQVYLFSGAVRELHASGSIASGTSCYALAPHPAVGGPDPWAAERLDPASVMVMDVGVWQGLCAQFVEVSRQADPA